MHDDVELLRWAINKAEGRAFDGEQAMAIQAALARVTTRPTHNTEAAHQVTTLSQTLDAARKGDYSYIAGELNYLRLNNALWILCKHANVDRKQLNC